MERDVSIPRIRSHCRGSSAGRSEVFNKKACVSRSRRETTSWRKYVNHPGPGVGETLEDSLHGSVG